MKHLKKIFEKSDFEIDKEISQEMRERITDCFNQIKNLKKSSEEFLIVVLGQGWWDPQYGGRYAYRQEHESFKISIGFKVGLKKNWTDRGAYGKNFERSKDTKEYLTDMSEIINECKSYIDQLKYEDVRIEIIDKNSYCIVYVILENEDLESIRKTKVKRMKSILDKYFMESDNRHQSKTMIINQPFVKGEKVREKYLDIYEILCDLQSLKDIGWKPERQSIKIRFTYSSKMEGETILIKFSPIKYSIDEERVKPLKIDSEYQNMMNIEVAKEIKRRISDYKTKDIIEDFTITSKGDSIKITLNP